MKHWFYRSIIYLVSIALISHLYAGFYVSNLLSLIGFAFILTTVNLIIKPILLLLTLPLTILTLGLFGLVINTWMLMLASSTVQGVHVDGFVSAFVTSLLITLVNALIAPKK